MLWTAGQKRVAREHRGQRAVIFEAARDAALAVHDVMGAKFTPPLRAPWYIEVADQPQVIRTPARRDRALAKLGAMFPGMVKGRPS